MKIFTVLSFKFLGYRLVCLFVTPIPFHWGWCWMIPGCRPYKGMCDKIVTPPFHFDHLPNLNRSQDSESFKNTCTFWGGLNPTDLFFSKNSKKNIFVVVRVRFETWALENQKKIIFLTFVFLGHHKKRRILSFFFGQPIQTSFLGKLPS